MGGVYRRQTYSHTLLSSTAAAVMSQFVDDTRKEGKRHIPRGDRINCNCDRQGAAKARRVKEVTDLDTSEVGTSFKN